MIVGHREGFIERAVLDHRQHRSEDFFADDFHVVAAIDSSVGRIEIARPSGSFPPVATVAPSATARCTIA